MTVLISHDNFNIFCMYFSLYGTLSNVLYYYYFAVIVIIIITWLHVFCCDLNRKTLGGRCSPWRTPKKWLSSIMFHSQRCNYRGNLIASPYIQQSRMQYEYLNTGFAATRMLGGGGDSSFKLQTSRCPNPKRTQENNKNSKTKQQKSGTTSFSLWICSQCLLFG